MKKIDFKIPPECSRISIKAEERRLILIFEPDTPNSFFCEETNIGDLAIMWVDDGNSAIISRVADIDYSDFTYKAKNGVWYKKAARFRDEEQYNKILQNDPPKKIEIKK